MRPGWVLDLQDYWTWIEQRLDASGGYLDEAYVALDVVVHEGADAWQALIVDKQRLTYALDGSYLDFRFTVGPDLELIGYAFHYARFDDQLVWRLDKHRGHEDEDGGDTHIHLPNNLRKAYEQVDLEQVLERIDLDQHDERRQPKPPRT